MLDKLKSEVSTLADTKFFWFALGVFLAQNDVPGVVTVFRAFLGV